MTATKDIIVDHNNLSSPNFNFDVHYKDTGCEESPKCLACPLAQCREDDWGAYELAKRRQVDLQVVAAIKSEGLTRGEAAERFGFTTRTISRIARRVRKEASLRGVAL